LRECAEKVKNMIPEKGNLSISMLQGKPKRRCIYIFEDIHCDREPAEKNKYCDEHINPQCLAQFYLWGDNAKIKSMIKEKSIACSARRKWKSMRR